MKPSRLLVSFGSAIALFSFLSIGLNRGIPSFHLAFAQVPFSSADSNKNPLANAPNLAPVPLDHQETQEFLDVRGVGDAGMALTYKQPLSVDQSLPRGGKANFGEKLDQLDPTGKSYQGDLSFINWESTVGTSCQQFRGRPSRSSYAFVSHPDNLVKAQERGFNLIGLANNHSWDCQISDTGGNGSLRSAEHLKRLTQQHSLNWLWHGVGSQKEPTIRTIKIKGNDVTVAFASLYLGQGDGDCTYLSCIENRNSLLQSFRNIDADLKILSIHSWNNATQQQLVNTGVDFLENYDGDIVFGHGPHVWKPVRIVESSSGKKGVMFESLGNFIHPSLGAQNANLIGRVLFDFDTMTLRQVQAIPVATRGANANFSQAPNPTQLPANVEWQTINDPAWSEGLNSEVRGVYTNINGGSN